MVGGIALTKLVNFVGVMSRMHALIAKVNCFYKMVSALTSVRAGSLKILRITNANNVIKIV